MLDFYKKITQIFPQNCVRGFYIILLIYVFQSILELMGLALIFPILSVMSDTSQIIENKAIFSIYEIYVMFLRREDFNSFITFLAIISFISVLFAALFRGVSQYYSNNFIEKVRHNISVDLLERYLSEDYNFFSGKRKSELAKNVLSETDQVVDRVIKPIVLMLSNSIILFAIVALLFAADPILLILTFSLLFLIYILIFIAVRKTLVRIGSQLVDANERRYFSAIEILNGAQINKFWNFGTVLLLSYLKASNAYSRNNAAHQTLAIIPTYIVETVVFGALVFFAISYGFYTGGFESGGLRDFLPLMGFYAVAIIRMKPLFQNIFNGLAAVRFGSAMIDNIFCQLQFDRSSQIALAIPKKFQSIELHNVSLRYSGDNRIIFSDVNVDIRQGDKVLVMGESGSGKTSLIHILSGLIPPSGGNLLVGGVKIDSANSHLWRSRVGYVGQKDFLLDASILENVIGHPADFGHVDDVSIARIEKCLKMVGLYDFVTKEFLGGLRGQVGENASLLSGGQRQRLCLARAIYLRPEFLILDEATSALDENTEAHVLSELSTQLSSSTIIAISHKQSSLLAYDQTIEVSGGKVFAK